MLKAYQGYFNNGRFISLDNVPIPNKKRVIITVLDDEITNIQTDTENQENPAQQQCLAFKEYFNAIDTIKGEYFEEADFIELESNRLNFRRELDL